MIAWLPLGGVAAGLAACAAAFLLWRAVSTQSEATRRLDDRLAEFAMTLERSRTARRDEALLDAVRALRDDVTILCTHVSSLTDGELETKKLVSAAVARELEPLIERLEESDAAAGRRAAALRERVEHAIERAGDDAEEPETIAVAIERLARVEALLETLCEDRAAPKPASESDVAPVPSEPRGAPRRAPTVFETGRVATVFARAGG